MRVQARPAGSRLWFLSGALLAALALIAGAELFLRWFPPRDLHAYLGEASPLQGIYAADPDFVVGYQSWEAFRDDNRKRLVPYLPLGESHRSRKVWAFFGNSFVHMEGMLADTARRHVKDREIFNLGKNEHIYLRCAQVKLLLEHGFRPERLFFELMPVDLVTLCEQPLRTLHVNSRGAITYQPRLPPAPFNALVGHSRFALTAWCRTGLQKGDARTQRSALHLRLEDGVLADARRLFGRLARVTRSHGVPVTVLLIPSYHHVQGEPCGFQDALTPLLRERGFDIFDPRDAFRKQADKPGLFLADKHFSPRGNQVLYTELIAHLRSSEAYTEARGR